MGILNSIALGKSRKSAGNVTFYNRIGVSCFRQKPVRSPGYKSTVPQRMQQSVFRFMKANVDASGVKAFVDTFYDAKPRKNKSETKFNMFYKAFMPHLVAQKPTIYELPVDDLVNPAIFLGTPASNQDKLTNGQLGVLNLQGGVIGSFSIDEVTLNQIIDKANTLISEKDVPYTTDNLFVGVFGADSAAASGYRLVQPTNVTPSLTNGAYTFDISALTDGMSLANNVYVALMVAGVDSSGSVDLMRRKFATDSALLNGAVAPVPSIDITGYTSADNWVTITLTVPTANLTAAGLTAAELVGKTVQFTNASGTNRSTIGSQAVSGANTTFTMPGINGDLSELSDSGADLVYDGDTVICQFAPAATAKPVID